MNRTETPITLRLSDQAKSKLLEQAARAGQDLSTVASDLIEHVVRFPSFGEITAPIQKDALASGMSDAEFEAFLMGELEGYRRNKKANAS